MDEAATCEAVKTDLPSRKANGGKRLGLRFAMLVVALAALVGAYGFTRPPELVWWRSPTIDENGHCLVALIPQGWEWDGELRGKMLNPYAGYALAPSEHRPYILRRLFPNPLEMASLAIGFEKPHSGKRFMVHQVGQVVRSDYTLIHSAERIVSSVDGTYEINIHYERTDLPAFNRTYKQICNSLRIE